MADMNRVSDDLEFVRSVVRRAEGTSNPPSICFLWALLSLPGFALIDFRPHWVGPYWAVAGPLGGLVSWLLAIRWSRKVGQESRREGVLHAIHWSGFMACILLLVPLASTGQLHHSAIPRVILLFIGLSYLTAGNYLDRRLRVVALVVFALYLMTFLIRTYTWTLSGIILATSLVAVGLLGGQRGARGN
jgi:hypothetical protein